MIKVDRLVCKRGFGNTCLTRRSSGKDRKSLNHDDDDNNDADDRHRNFGSVLDKRNTVVFTEAAAKSSCFVFVRYENHIGPDRGVNH